jgi:hypothetical protein
MDEEKWLFNKDSETGYIFRYIVLVCLKNVPVRLLGTMCEALVNLVPRNLIGTLNHPVEMTIAIYLPSYYWYQYPFNATALREASMVLKCLAQGLSVNRMHDPTGIRTCSLPL